MTDVLTEILISGQDKGVRLGPWLILDHQSDLIQTNLHLDVESGLHTWIGLTRLEPYHGPEKENEPLHVTVAQSGEP